MPRAFSAKRLGAPGSVARHVQSILEADPDHFGENRYLVFEYGDRGPGLVAAQASESGALKHMRYGRILVDVFSYFNPDV